MAAIKQHAIAEKRVGKGMPFPFFSPLIDVWLDFKAYGDARMCFEMQNKLSNTRVSPLGSME